MNKRVMSLAIVLSMVLTFGFQAITFADGAATPADIVSLLSPEYRSDLNGETELKISAPGGYEKAFAYYTDAPDDKNPHPMGHTVTVGPVDLDENGIGTIKIDSNDMPNGPVMILVEAVKADGASCTGYFQFFNLKGEEWNAGMTGYDKNIKGYYDPEIALPEFINQNQAKLGRPAMQTVFADDMNYADNDDIKEHISRNGIDKTYAGHYPNHKDDRAGFFGPEKGDEMGQDFNPYRSVKGTKDSYLLMIDRVHDVETGAPDWGGITRFMTSPCLSSISEEGHSASLPDYPDWDGWTNGYTEQYLEARIFFGPAPGTWPAFWTLSDGPYKREGVFTSDDDGGKNGWRGTDEIDIVEAWHPTNSFSINIHAWNYTPVSKDTTDFGSGVKNWTSMEIAEKAGTDARVGDFMMGFHTYGCYITKDLTYYFLDGELIGSHKTLPLSYRDGNRFLINTGIDATKHQAFADGYGFDRYGDSSYTYLDWVRIWEAPNDPDTPMFDVDYDAMETQGIKPGDELKFSVKRINDAAKSSVVSYSIDLPEGWEIEGDTTFEPSTGSDLDEITLKVPLSYVDQKEIIDITPVVDGKNTDGLYIITENIDDSFGIDRVYPYYNSAKGTYEVYTEISNREDAKTASAAGKITLTADGEEYVSEFPALQPGEAYLLPPFEDVKLDKLKAKDYKFTLTREDGYERVSERKISALTLFKCDDFDFGNDGTPFDISQWEDGTSVELCEYTGNVNPEDKDDLSVTVYSKWSDNFLYIGAVAKDEDFKNANVENFGSLWDADSIQLSFDPTREYGYANAIGKEHIRLTGGINNQNVGGLGLETFLFNDYKPEDIKTNFYRSEDEKTTYYMIAIPWGAILENGVPVVDGTNVTEDIGFTMLINDRDGSDSRVWMRYMDGIGSGKRPELFGDMILSGGSTEKAEVKFIDVNEGDWFCDDVYYAVENGLFKGTSENEFSPEEAMTRAMFVTVLYRMDKPEAINAENPFKDVPNNEYYTDAVKWAVKNGIVKGTSEDTFEPDTPISRQDIAVILNRYRSYSRTAHSGVSELGSASHQLTDSEKYNNLKKTFKDADTISDYALNSVFTMNQLGIINGSEDSTIKPLDNATRAEVAAMLHRFMESIN